MAFIIKYGKQFFSSKKQNRISITQNILKKITDEKLFLISDLNLNTTFKVDWARFMKIEKLSYITTKTKKAIFVETGNIQSDILLEKNDQYAILLSR